MCDTLCAAVDGGMLFAKASDRPLAEPQVVEALPERPPGGTLATQYLEIPDRGAAAMLASRPTWLWGLEHGVNRHRVAVGNEKIYTSLDPYALPAALIGMDLVRLALERGATAEEAMTTITTLLGEHGQGGVGDETSNEPYFSSFLIADPHEAWVVETSGATWAARRSGPGAAISNRLTIRRDHDRASPDVGDGADFDAWRNKDAPTGHADVRLASSNAFLAQRPAGPSSLVAHLRDHGSGPWGAPGTTGRPAPVPPPSVMPDGSGASICLHARHYQATAAAMVAQLSADAEAPLRAWVALGSPCVSVFVPVFPPAHAARELADPELWWRFAHLRDAVEADGGRLGPLRGLLDPFEDELWAEADAIAASPGKWAAFAGDSGRRIVEVSALACDAVGAAR